MNNHNKIFNNIFQQNYSHTKEAHARVNLIGEHTDYTGGYVLPCLLKYKTIVSIAENKSSECSTAVRKPTPPQLIPKTGLLRLDIIWSKVPSPPKEITKSP